MTDKTNRTFTGQINMDDVEQVAMKTIVFMGKEVNKLNLTSHQKPVLTYLVAETISRSIENFAKESGLNIADLLEKEV